MAIKYDGIPDSGGYIMGISGSKNNAPTDKNPFTGKAYGPDGYSVAQLQTDRANGTAMQANGTFQPPKAPQAPQAPAFDQAAYMAQMQSQVNSIYDQQKQAQLSQYYVSRDKALGQVNQQKAEVAPQYQSARNQADVVSAQNVQRLREMMASNGLQSSGENVTANVGLQNARQNSLNRLNLQEQQINNDFNRQISDLNNPAQEQALVAALEAQRSQALFDSSMRADEVGYSRNRDATMDNRYNNEFAYQQSRDTVGDQQWQTQFDYGQSIDNRNFDYQQGRDKIGDSQWNKQFDYGQSVDNRNFNYQQGRDKIGDSQWNQQFDYGKTRDKIGDSQWNQQFNQGNQQWQQQFNQSNQQYADDKAWKQYTYNNMSASEKASMDRAASQFGEEMAWRMYSLEYQGELDKSISNAQTEAYRNGNFNQGAGTGYLSQAEFGSLSRKYESNGNPGTVARTKGDLGGASYGSYQLTTTSGHAQKFANSYGGALKGLKAGTTAFDNAWKSEASKNSKAFNNAQHNYIQSNHYEPAANRFQSITGIKLDTMPKAVKDMVWSIGVQHGAGGAATIFKNSGVKAGMKAASIITNVYKERMKVDKYFSSSPKNIKNSVLKRFRNEMQDALNMLK